MLVHSRHFSLMPAVATVMEKLFGWLTGHRSEGEEEERRDKDTSSITSRERGRGGCG